MTDTECHGHISDLVCVGFGPAALALAIAFLEKKRAYIARGKPLPLDTITFIEKSSSFQWHPGMLLPGASMQIRRVL
ncbi:uncharacterized protein EI90DRAFT_3055038 [Cantharellus anzutake]|uniref:uncharacterized protein n=1 Tax=Cantharellus anzutake TaxID=1750568 RepID=UPI0019056055|nr:uncharacterized protein EI90DRAFT_3054741 [Cantharellus anzutake]XP_038916757.1 uncharacterized protein EI90DRAFT_3055038 [Cantharellus anzutake]KAF8332241.1 hypothetical protein EI90DRAFT_3054741 [Cantharellus anzutake]KAF8332314.1 hypothetical protein EI90DRAFT_3055038 [Cantharellus anzutake]